MSGPAKHDHAATPTLALGREWARVGVLFNVQPADARIDLEKLVVRTAAVARDDERLCIMAASWLAAHHHLLDARRFARQLLAVDANTSAVAGVLLSMAVAGVPGTTALHAAVSHCRPLRKRQPLYRTMEKYPRLLRLVQRETLPLFRTWGFWHNDATLKLNAVRPISWIVKHCPELRVRAVLGPGLDAELVECLVNSPGTVTELSRRTGASYAATHAATSRLAARGLLVRGKHKRCNIGTLLQDLLTEQSGPFARAG